MQRTFLAVWMAASLVWVIYWAWRFIVSCVVFDDRFVCFSDDLGWLYPVEPIGPNVIARVIALTLGIPLVVFVLGAALVWARRERGPE